MNRPAFLEPLFQAPRWARVLLGVLVVVAVGVGGYLLVVSPIETRVASLRAQRAAQQQELTQLRAMAAELARVRREAAEVEQRLETAKAKLPTEREMPALYRALSDAAIQSGLAVALFQPQASKTRDFYNEIPISLVAEGGYHDVGDFVGRVATLPRAATIGELKLTATKPDSRPAPAARPGDPARSGAASAPPRRPVRADITLLTFVYRPVGSPPAPKPAGPGGKPEAAKP
jgi:type IV pilus assembly protein PilO